MAARESWIDVYDRAYARIDRRSVEEAHLSELSFALEAQTWLAGGVTHDCP